MTTALKGVPVTIKGTFVKVGDQVLEFELVPQIENFFIKICKNYHHSIAFKYFAKVFCNFFSQIFCKNQKKK